jgi:hypothetical protein
LTSRTAFPGTSTTGITHTAAHDNDLPGGQIGRITRDTDSSLVTAETDLTGVTQAVTVNTSRMIKISFDGAYAASSGAGNRALFRIKEGSTVLKARYFAAAQNGVEACSFWVIVTPTSGSHTYKISLASQDAGSVQLKAASDQLCELLIEDIGPA